MSRSLGVVRNLAGVVPASITDPAQAATRALAIGARFGRVVLAPLGTGADDTLRFGAVVKAVNGCWPIHLLGGPIS